MLIPEVGLGVHCPQPDACGAQHSVCSPGGVCVCDDIHYDDNGISLNGTCRDSEFLSLTFSYARRDRRSYCIMAHFFRFLIAKYCPPI